MLPIPAIAIGTLILAGLSEASKAPTKRHKPSPGPEPIPPQPKAPEPPPEEIEALLDEWDDLPDSTRRLIKRFSFFMGTRRFRLWLQKKVTQQNLLKAAKSPKLWRLFWSRIVAKLGIRGSIAAALVMADGPIPLGDLLALGLTIWTIYDMVIIFNDVWDQIEMVEEMVKE
jgi:hypothetical protein